MRCRQVEPLLVAFEEDELSPGEAQLVADHMDHCPTCRQRLELLANVTIEPHGLDAAFLASQMERLELAVLDSPALQAPPIDTRTYGERFSDWLSSDSQIPNGYVIAYAALGMSAVGWGLWSWSQIQEPEVQLPTVEVAMPTAAPARVEVVPAEQYLPASYTPERDVF